MHFARPTNGTILGAVALFVALGGTALAATGTIVHIADPVHPARVAHVDGAGKLLIGDGAGNMTVDGTVTAQSAPPSAFWRASGTASSSCSQIGAPPAGKAVILRSITINVYSAPAGTFSGNTFITVFNNSSCTGTPIWDVTPTQLGVTTMQFDPGVAIPSSGALSVSDFSGAGYGIEAYATGYTVPASAVPSSAAAIRPRATTHSGPPAAADG
jgi:hypothetical protein